MNPSNVPIETGIYRITCKPTGRSYIGSCVHTRERCSSHRSALRGGRHHNHLLQADWNVHGEDAFEFVIVEVVTSTGHLLQREREWISEYQDTGNSYNEFCYISSRPQRSFPMNAYDNLLTMAEVAKSKGVSKEAVRLAVKSGALHPTRRVSPMLFHPSDVERWTPHVAVMRRAARARKAEEGQG